MIKDYSDVPVKITLKNDNDNAVKFNLRDNWKEVPVEIKSKDELVILIETSEAWALLVHKAEEMNLELTTEDVTYTEVASEEDLKNAISNGEELVKLSDNITVPEGNLDITGVKYFDGNGNYGIQCYNGNYVIKNCKATNCNAGILVNSSNVTLQGTIDVSGNKFGGIEVSKSSSPQLPNATLNINGATIVNTTEEYAKPTIWTDGEGNTVNGAEAMFTNSEVREGQVQYYLQEANAQEPIVYNIEVASPEASTDILGKTVEQLQSNVVVSEDNIEGTLNYVTDYTSFSAVTEEQEGNYLALKVLATKNDEDIEKVSVTMSESQSEVFLDSDRLHVVRIVNKEQTLTVKAYEEDEVVYEKSYSLSNLVLLPKSEDPEESGELETDDEGTDVMEPVD